MTPLFTKGMGEMFTFKQRGVCLLCDLFHVFTLSRNIKGCNETTVVSQNRQIVNVFNGLNRLERHILNETFYKEKLIS